MYKKILHIKGFQKRKLYAQSVNPLTAFSELRLLDGSTRVATHVAPTHKAPSSSRVMLTKQYPPCSKVPWSDHIIIPSQTRVPRDRALTPESYAFLWCPWSSTSSCPAQAMTQRFIFITFGRWFALEHALS